MNNYLKEFYLALQEGALQSARTIVPLVIELIQPSSIIDIGCGNGAWISIFREHGIEDVIGVDGDWVKPEMLLFSTEKFISGDLERPFRVNRQFDLVISLEVAEHLPPDSAETFLDSLTRLGPVILFSAAIPFQGGTNHLNEQWPSYWADLFLSKGYVAVDCLRRRIWDNDQIDWWYAQNIMFFVKEDQIVKYPLLKAEYEKQHPGIFSAMHPKALMEQQRQSLELHQREAELTQCVEALSKEGEDLRQREAELTQCVEALSKEGEDLRQGKAELTQRVEALSKEGDDLQLCKADLVQRVEALGKEREDLHQREAVSLECVTSLSNKVMEMQQQITDLKSLKPGQVSLKTVLRALPTLILHAIRSRK